MLARDLPYASPTPPPSPTTTTYPTHAPTPQFVALAQSGNDDDTLQDVKHSKGYLQRLNTVAEREGFLRTTTKTPTPAPYVRAKPGEGLRHSALGGKATHIKSMYELIDEALLDASVPDAATGVRDDDDASKAKSETVASASPLYNPWAKP